MSPAARAPERRPRPALLLYDALRSLLLGPLFFLLLIPRAIRYRTLRYTFDAAGISMRWGALFRREVHLSYARIQDIHVRTNVLERWLGLGRLLIQTASGSAGAEVTIEGLPDFEELRDRIYARMAEASPEKGPPADPAAADASDMRVLAANLEAVAAELAAVRRAFAEARPARATEDEAP